MTDWTELNRTRTNPRRADSDGDSLSDWTELYRTRTDPRKADSDGDGADDGTEVRAGSDPRNPASVPPVPPTEPPTDPPTPPVSPPNTAITSGPSGTTTANGASFSFTSTSQGSTFECRLDTPAWSKCDSPKAYSDLIAGDHLFSVRALDSAGQADPTPATRAWTVEVDAPPPGAPVEAAWDIPPEPKVGIPVTLSAIDSSGDHPLNCHWSFENATGSIVWETREGCVIDFTFEATGVKYVELTVSDADGESDVNKQSFSVAAAPGAPDTQAPNTTISAGPAGTTTATTADFSFTSSESGSSFECQLDGAAYGSCSSPKSYAELPVGAHTFAVRATDAAGNVDASPATRAWTVGTSTPPTDTTPPNTTIDSGPSGTTTSTSASFGFSATEQGSTFQCMLDSGSWAGCTSPKAYSSLAAGAHTFSVRATDGAGNVDASPATRAWTVDGGGTTPPVGTAHCFSSPHTCGYPDQTNTGVPPGTNLTPSGGLTVSQAGQVINGLDVSGAINITANNVTIENTRVTLDGTGCGPTSTCGNFEIRINQGVSGVVIKNSELRVAAGTTCEHDIRNTSGPSLKIIGVYMHGCDSNLYGGATMTDSYGLAKLAISADHVENIYFNDTTFTSIHNTLLNPVPQTAVIFGNSNGGTDTTNCTNQLTVTNSLLAGGGYSLYPCAHASQPGSSFTNVQGNHFARCTTAEVYNPNGGTHTCQGGPDSNGYYPFSGDFGIAAFYFSEAGIWKGNVWDDNLAPVCIDRSPGCA